MLSYRHGYHAGNHADVIKHLVLLGLLEHMHQKDKPFVGIDTHSGNGFYRLDSAQAKKTREAASGIIPLWRAWQSGKVENALIKRYLELVAGFNPPDVGSVPDCYPGSPAIIHSLLRDQDRLQLMELHTSEIDLLRHNFGRDRRGRIHHRDGFEGAVAVSPPTPRRGLMLIDPAYEDKNDYQRAIKTVLAVHERWQTGIIALWYPMLGKSRDHSRRLTEQLSRKLESCVIELVVAPQSDEFGMFGSGMVVVNPPWQFEANFTPVLTVLNAVLGGMADTVPGRDA